MATQSTINPNGLKVLVSNYLGDSELYKIDEAWDIAITAHEGGRHFSGELYVIHLLEVASTLASMRLDRRVFWSFFL